jgi:GNAT superfamily N-acetyltransferase
MWIYRLAGEADLPQLAEMRWDFRTEHEGIPFELSKERFLTVCLEFLQRAFKSGRWSFWLADQDGQILTNAFVQRIEKVPSPTHLAREFGYVTNVYTRPAWRRQGIGAGLIQTVQEWAAAQGLEMLVLWPARPSVEFYRRAGFLQPGEEMEYPLDE